MKEIPINGYLRCRRDLCYWLYLIHKKVNNKLEKSTESFEEYNKQFEQYRANSCQNGGCHQTLLKPQCKIKIVSSFSNKKKSRRRKRISKRKSKKRSKRKSKKRSKSRRKK